MKKVLYIFLALCAFAATSCDSFLNRQEDEQMTFEKIWQQRSYTQQAFYNCMGYLPVDGNILTQSGCCYTAATDEATLFNETAGFNNIIRGSMGPSTMPHNMFSTWYEGIRDCTIFMQNVYTCSDPNATKDDLDRWYWGAKFTRAYLYFLLMREWGPIFILGEELIDFTATTEDLYRQRDSWDACVDYVVSELKECSENLPDTWDDGFLGMPTRGACLAVIARLKLYSARPLFNGNSMYRSVRNPDGTSLFPDNPDPNKWAEAAQANLDVIQTGTYQLYKDAEHKNDPYYNYSGIFKENWNSEVIFCSGGYRSNSTFMANTSPTSLLKGSYNGSGQWGPTQQQVDAYAMANGRYPITGYESDGSPKVDVASGYPAAANEFTITSVANPYLKALDVSSTDYTSSSPLMYKDREPRFYINVYYPGSYFKCAAVGGVANFAIDGSGRGQFYPRSGYMVNKYYDHSRNYYQNGSVNYITFPTFRLGEIYLNYIEAVLECEINGVTGQAVDHNYAMELWKELRERSGMGPITDAYPEATTPELLLDLVRKERRVELAHEGHRYFDTRTWMISTEVDAGYMYGLNVVYVKSQSPSVVPADGWARNAYERRTFTNSYYLLPFAQREVDRNKLMTQNYGW